MFHLQSIKHFNNYLFSKSLIQNYINKISTWILPVCPQKPIFPSQRLMNLNIANYFSKLTCTQTKNKTGKFQNVARSKFEINLYALSYWVKAICVPQLSNGYHVKWWVSPNKWVIVRNRVLLEFFKIYWTTNLQT